MDYLSVIPPIAAILGAAVTKKIIPSLVFGLLAGSIANAGWSLTGGLLAAGNYLSRVIANPDHAYIILFLFSFGALAEMFKAGGGIAGFSQAAAPYVKTERGALASVFLATPISFLDCCFHVIATSTISKPLLEKAGGSKEKLAFIINTTSSQLVALVPFATTYVGYILGVIGSSMAQTGIQGSPYLLYLHSVFLNFYSLIMVAISVMAVFFPLDFSFLALAHPAYKKDTGAEGPHHTQEGHEEAEFDENVPPRLANLLLPLVLLLAAIVYLFWLTGREKTGAGFAAALLNADYEKAIFVATLATLVFTAVFYALQKIPMQKLQKYFLSGGTEMLPPLVILVLAWAITAVTQDLGFNAFVGSFLTRSAISAPLVPVLIFAIGGFASYFMGSSWGTWALIMPLGISIATVAGASLPLTVGAVLAGGSIGDNLSPLGETPVLTAATANLSVTEHIGYVFPYGMVAIVLAAILYVAGGYYFASAYSTAGFAAISHILTWK
ncbi:Hypothetical protein LUCI_4357 [Lucifera butyrica]|uniref:Na+/H+ antiporter NhaC-like C-terminal domain-containing protein n=1 Tax=Lucifera butyrica TaxID=1351585 RepID=A0A498RCE6_9FIRM|nr:Na+/H+ antiporter NhaC family protein [Lucifera butyrica]VBB09071.1 Hypothetical protein LUCI_4357 [Lucifera butyrica]